MIGTLHAMGNSKKKNIKLLTKAEKEKKNLKNEIGVAGNGQIC